jgi:hypothetical protein
MFGALIAITLAVLLLCAALLPVVLLVGWFATWKTDAAEALDSHRADE